MLASVARGTSYRYPVLRWVSKMHFIYRSCTPDTSQRSTGYLGAVRVATLAMKMRSIYIADSPTASQRRTGYLVTVPRATLGIKNALHMQIMFTRC